MARQADAIIIGAGVIGAATAFELGKRGYKTLNIDKLPTSGYGPTSNSCAIVRAHYSSRDGVAMAYEGFFYWQDWERYLGVVDDMGTSRYMQCGTVLLKSATGHHEKVLAHYRDLGVEYEEWDNATLVEKVPVYSTDAFWPPKRPDDPHFWDEPRRELDGAIFTPGSGYVNDPQLATPQPPARRRGQGRRVPLPRRGGRDPPRRRPRRRRDARPTAPRSTRRSWSTSPARTRSSSTAWPGVEDEMNVKTRALRHEVHHVPSPPDFDFEHDGYHTSDGDTGIYFRPESGNNILIGSEDPDCDPRVWVDEPDKFDRHVTEQQWEAQVYRLARRMPVAAHPQRAQGDRRPLRRLRRLDPDLRPLGPRRLLHGDRHERQPVQERPGRRPPDGRAHRPRRARPRPRRRPDQGPLRLQLELELDAGFYSRRREVNPNSSFSVNG